VAECRLLKNVYKADTATWTNRQAERRSNGFNNEHLPRVGR
jgi:hypothetical protein